MKFKTFITIHTVVLFLFGLPTLISPRFIWGMYGMEIEGEAIYLVHLLGGLMTANVILSWFYREVSDRKALKAISYQQIWAWLAAFGVGLIGQLTGVMNAMGWSAIVLSALFVAAWIYYGFFFTPVAGQSPAGMAAQG